MGIMFANILFTGLTKSSLFHGNHFRHVITGNAEIIVMANRIPDMKRILNSNVTTIDGQLPFLLIKKKVGKENLEKISGSELIYDVAGYCSANNKRLFLLGGTENVNSRAVANLKEKFHIEVEGFSPPHSPYPFPQENNEKIFDRIRDFKPDFLFVGFGAVKQEFWIDDNRALLESLGIKMVVGSGGTFDFVSGKKRRAPVPVQKICMEGVWRLFAEFRWFRLKRLFRSLMIFRYIKA